MPKAKRKPSPPKADEDALAFHSCLESLISGIGRGGLSFVASRLGVTPSMLLRRLKNPPAFDAVTMRAVILIQQSRVADDTADPAPGAIQAGNFIIEIQDGEPKWRPAQ